MPDEFQTMREIGRTFFGVSSHTVGRKLRELGLRTTDGKPPTRHSPVALSSGSLPRITRTTAAPGMSEKRCRSWRGLA